MDYDYLYEICQLKQWKTIPNKELTDDGFPVYGANGIIGYYSEYNHANETLLLGCRGTCGSVHISKPFSYINGNALCLDNLLKSYNINFVYYFLKSLDYSKIISGTGIPQITQMGLKNVTIPKYSLEKQVEISNKLCNIDKLIEKNKLLLNEFENFVKSQFIEMFGNHEKTELSNIAEIIMGQSPESKSYNDIGEGVPFFQGKADYGEKYTIVKHWTTNPTKMARKNSVLMSVRAPVGPVNIANVDCCIGRGLCSIDSLNGKTNNEFLYNALKVMESDIALMGSGSTFKAINKNDIYNLMLPNAPLDLQNEFSLFAQQIDKSKYFGGVYYGIC